MRTPNLVAMIASAAKIKIAARQVADTTPTLKELSDLILAHPEEKRKSEQEAFDLLVPAINQHLRVIAGEGRESFGMFRLYHLCEGELQQSAFKQLLKTYLEGLGLIISNSSKLVTIPLTDAILVQQKGTDVS